MSAVTICDACSQTIDDGDARYTISVSPSAGLRLGLTDNITRLLEADSRGERKRLMAEVQAADKASVERARKPEHRSYDLHAECFDTHLGAAFAALRRLP